MCRTTLNLFIFDILITPHEYMNYYLITIIIVILFIAIIIINAIIYIFLQSKLLQNYFGLHLIANFKKLCSFDNEWL